MVSVLMTLHRVVLFATVLVALVATGFAHRMPDVSDDAIEYALQNGISLSDLCGDDLEKSSHSAATCEACQITCASDLPPLTGMAIDLELAFHASVIAPREVRALPSSSDPAHQPQGPPAA